MDKKEAIHRLQQLCSRSEKCISDVTTKLRLWNAEKHTEEIVDLLIKEKYIDEQRYSNAFVNDKYKLSKWGRIKIRYSLKSKGIPDEVVEEALQQVDVELYKKTVFDEFEKKWNKINIPEKRRNSLFSFCAQRGYEQELIYSWMNEKNIS